MFQFRHLSFIGILILICNTVGVRAVATPIDRQTSPANFLVDLADVKASGGTLTLSEGTYQGPVVISASLNNVTIKAKVVNGVTDKVTLQCSKQMRQAYWHNVSGTSLYETVLESKVAQVFMNGAFLKRARYPYEDMAGLIGLDPAIKLNPASTTPDLRFLYASENSEGKFDLKPSPADLAYFTSAGVSLAGATITARLTDYWYHSAVVESVNSTGIKLNQKPGNLSGECRPTCDFSYPPKAGWGYFLENKRWMMRPGTWVFEDSTNKLLVWMPDGTNPNNSISVASYAPCLKIADSKALILNGFVIENSGGPGIHLQNSDNIQLQWMTIQNTAAQGIFLGNSKGLTLRDSKFKKIGQEAILGDWTVADNITDSHNLIQRNKFEDIGTPLAPRFQRAAIFMYEYGPKTQVLDNTFLRLSYTGVDISENSNISRNTFENFCLYNDDCGGVHTSGNHSGIVMDGNIFKYVPATTNNIPSDAFLKGKLAGRPAFAIAGIYLDNFSYGATIRNNTITDIPTGIFLHNSHHNNMYNNTISGATYAAIRLDEDEKMSVWSNRQWVIDPVNPDQPTIVQNSFNNNSLSAVSTAALFFYKTNRPNASTANLKTALTAVGNKYKCSVTAAVRSPMYLPTYFINFSTLYASDFDVTGNCL